MADEEQNEAADEQKGGSSKKKLLLIGIPLILVLVGGGVFGFLMMGSEPGAPSAEQTEGGEEAKEETEEKAEGEASKPSEGDAKEASEGEQKEGAAEPGKEGKKAKAGEEEDEDDQIAVYGVGKTFTFKSFQLNLANPIANHYVRVDISVEFRTPKAEKELQLRKAQLRDAIVTIVSSKTREFLQNPDGKEQLRAEILRTINHYMKNKIEQVYITDILIE